MEQEKSLDGKKLEGELQKMDEVYLILTKWAKAIIFNENGIIAHKNCNAKKE